MNTSIIIPTFNSESTIEKTINSILKQSIKPYEIIVSDGGSTDKTIQIIERISEKNKEIKLIKKKGFGISASRNIGVKQASGEIIVFLDSDVITEEKWLEKLLACMEKEKPFCCCGKYSVELTKSLASDFFSFVVSSSSFQGYNIAFRKKDFLELKGFDEKMKYSEDPEFTLRAFLSGKKLAETNAETFHLSYSLKERIKSNFKYSFFDAVLFKKNISFFFNPFNLLKSPKNIKLIFGFYWVLFFSFFLSVVSLIITKNIFSLVFLLVPALTGCIKIILNENKTKYENNFFLLLGYSFFALILFGLIKGAGFLNGLIQGKY
jgi:glycosyltransferase involved in cell wall biosynthesis